MLLLFGYIIGAARLGTLSDITSGFFGFITAPVKYMSSSISGSASNFVRKFVQADEINQENIELKEKNRVLEEQLVELQDYQIRIDELEQYFELHKENPDQEYVSGLVIARDPSDKFCSFSIDVGSLDNISINDPVITSYGLVGIVWDVNLTDCKVKTILNPSVNVGAYSSKTLDVGIIEGTLELAIENRTRMHLIPNESTMKAGDTIVSSGVGGIFPKGLSIGKAIEVNKESTGTSKYAIIEPSVDVSSVKEVMVIVSFRGQSNEKNILP
jgi:rod shape-determining protein MreC